MKQRSFLRGAVILAIGGVFAKVLGAVYRIPLTNLLGSRGIGLYQLVFPMYTLLLTVSGAGIPVAISKLIARDLQCGNRSAAKRTFFSALGCLTILGGIGSAALFFAAEPLARLQGNLQAAACYRILSPSVLLVAVLAAFRGYFQGGLNMAPTAASQVTEQLVKTVLGLVLAYSANDAITGAKRAVFAVTASEVVAVLFVAVWYAWETLRSPRVKPAPEKRGTVREILLLAVPVTLGSLLLPFTQLVDSVLVMRLLPGDATQLYGLWSGPVHSLLNMPVVLTLGIATAVLPSVTGCYVAGDEAGLHEKCNLAFRLTTVLGLPCSVGLAVLAKPVVCLLYGGLTAAEQNLSAELLQIAAAGVLFLSLAQTSTAILQGTGRLYRPVAFLGIAALCKTVCNVLLLPKAGVHGAAISSVVCYFVAGFADFLYIIVKYRFPADFDRIWLKPLTASAFMAVCVLCFCTFFRGFAQSAAGTLFALLLGVVSYGTAVLAMKVFSARELSELLPSRRKKEKEYT